MVHIPIGGVGTAGIVLDVPGHMLPPEAWTAGKNVRFYDDKAEKFFGHVPVFGTPNTAPLWGLGLRTANEVFWLYADLTSVHVFANALHTDITRTVGGAYSADPFQLWNGGLLGNIPILNNGADVPQMWSPATPATALADLTNWPGTLRANIVRPFKNFLFALDVTKSGTRFPHMVKWSHPADPGAVPPSWDETDPTRDTGEVELSSEQSGFIVDGARLHDLFIVYKEGSVHGFQFVGGQNIFNNFTIFNDFGAMTTDCVARFDRGARHFVMSGDDLIIHDGQTSQSVATKRVRDFIQKNIDSTNFRRSFVVVNNAFNEVWFCFPEKGALWCTLAVVWNFRENAFGFRELEEVPYIATGVIAPDTPSDTWDADTEAWDADTTTWNVQGTFAATQGMLLLDQQNTKLQQLDATNTFDGTPFDVLLERTGLAVIGQDHRGNFITDLERRKMIKRIWIRAEGSPFSVQVGSQEEVEGVVDWAPAKVFTPGVDKYLDFIVTGRLMAVRFLSTGDVNWRVYGYDIELELLGAL